MKVLKMKVEHKKDELIIRVSDKAFGVAEIQDLLDYLKAKSIISKSNANESDVEHLSKEIKNSWWSKNKSRFIK